MRAISAGDKKLITCKAICNIYRNASLKNEHTLHSKLASKIPKKGGIVSISALPDQIWFQYEFRVIQKHILTGMSTKQVAQEDMRLIRTSPYVHKGTTMQLTVGKGCH